MNLIGEKKVLCRDKKNGSYHKLYRIAERVNAKFPVINARIRRKNLCQIVTASLQTLCVTDIAGNWETKQIA
jgi:hypothetical protein